MYDRDFRAAAVARVNAGEPVQAVARSLGVARNTLKAWVSRVGADSSAPEPDEASPVAVAAASGSLRDTLVALRAEIAGRVAGVADRELPAYARLLAETMREIEKLEGQAAHDDGGDVGDEPFNGEDDL